MRAYATGMLVLPEKTDCWFSADNWVDGERLLDGHLIEIVRVARLKKYISALTDDKWQEIVNGAKSTKAALDPKSQKSKGKARAPPPPSTAVHESIEDDDFELVSDPEVV